MKCLLAETPHGTVKSEITHEAITLRAPCKYSCTVHNASSKAINDPFHAVLMSNTGGKIDDVMRVRVC